MNKILTLILLCITTTALAWFDPTVGTNSKIYITSCNGFDTLSPDSNYDVGDTNAEITLRSGQYSTMNVFNVGSPIQLLVKFNTDLTATFIYGKLEYITGTNSGASAWTEISTITDITDIESVEGAHFGLITWYPPDSNTYYLIRISAKLQKNGQWYYTPAAANPTNGNVNITKDGGIGWPDWNVLGIKTIPNIWSSTKINTGTITGTNVVPYIESVIGLTASAGTIDNTVELSWPAVTNFNIYRSRTKTGAIKIAETDTLTYDDTNAVATVKYDYSVSITSTIPVVGYRILKAPQGTVTPYVTKGTYSDRITISWPSILLADSYDVKRNGVLAWTGVQSPVSDYPGYQIPANTAYSNYTYSVCPKNFVGTGEYGAEDFGFYVTKLAAPSYSSVGGDRAGEGHGWWVLNPLTVYWTKPARAVGTYVTIQQYWLTNPNKRPPNTYNTYDTPSTSMWIDQNSVYNYQGSIWTFQSYGSYPAELSDISAGYFSLGTWIAQ